MNDLKYKNELKKIIHNTKNLIKRDTENIPKIEELNDKNKGEWVDHGDDDFTKIYSGLLNYCKDENEEFDNLDWNSVNYEILGEEYYQNKFPGFPDEVIKYYLIQLKINLLMKQIKNYKLKIVPLL